MTTTLDGRASLPYRIHWVAHPSAPGDDVEEVDFLIDGRLGWQEHNAPYFYGNDGNWLVTSFLKPGTHSFTVKVVGLDGQEATDTVTAKVKRAPASPSGLTATWARTVTDADVKKATSGELPPPGHWQLTIDSKGWHLRDPQNGGLSFDVGYQSAGRLQIRPTIEYLRTRTRPMVASARTRIRCPSGATLSPKARTRSFCIRWDMTRAATASLILEGTWHRVST